MVRNRKWDKIARSFISVILSGVSLQSPNLGNRPYTVSIPTPQYLGHPWTAINGPSADKSGVRFYFHLCGSERIFNWKFRRSGVVGTRTGNGSSVVVVDPSTSGGERVGPSWFDCLTCKKVDECAAEDQVLFDSIL